jgi:hypothetical protein
MNPAAVSLRIMENRAQEFYAMTAELIPAPVREPILCLPALTVRIPRAAS